MNRTNVDYLFQLTAPADRGPTGPLYFGVEAPRFNDHLALASETSLDESSKTDLKAASLDYARPDDHRRLGSSAEPTRVSSNDPPPSDCSACGEPESQPTVANAETDSHDEPTAAAGADPGATAIQNADGSDASSDGDNDNASDAEQSVAVASDAAHSGAITAAVAAADSAEDTLGREPTDDDHRANAEVELHDAASNRDDGRPQGKQPVADAFSTKPDAGNPADTKVDPERDGAAETHAAEQTTRTSSVAAGAEPNHHGRESEHDVSGDSRDETTIERRTTVNESSSAKGALAGDTAKSAEAGQAKVDKPAAVKGRTSARSNSDESRRGAESSSEARPDAAVSSNKAVAIANQATAPAMVAAKASEATGDDASKASRSAAKRSDSLLHAVARANRHHGTAGRTGRGATADQTPRIDATRFVGRVAKAVQTANERGGPLQLRLSPPELGSLRLELNVQNGVMTAALETETPAARQVLLDHLPALRERLAEQNIRIERFDVDVRQEGSGGQADSRASQQEQPQRQPYDPPSRHSFRRTPSSDNEQPTSMPLPIASASSGIDVVA